MDKKFFVQYLRNIEKEYGITDNSVIDSRSDDKIVDMYRVCFDCGKEFWTEERMDKILKENSNPEIILSKLYGKHINGCKNCNRNSNIECIRLEPDGRIIMPKGHKKKYPWKKDLCDEHLKLLCSDDNIHMALKLLFWISVWAKRKDLLLYKDRQGLYEIKNIILGYIYKQGLIKAVQYVDRTRVLGLVDHVDVGGVVDRMIEMFEYAEVESIHESYTKWLCKALNADSSVNIYEDGFLEEHRKDLEKYICDELDRIEDEAWKARMPISIEKLEELDIDYNEVDFIKDKVSYLGFRCCDWCDLDESFLGDFDPEYYNLVVLRHEDKDFTFEFEVPFRTAEKFMKGLFIRQLPIINNAMGESAECEGRILDKENYEKYPIDQLINSLAIVNINRFCPSGLINKNRYVELKNSYNEEDYYSDEEDEDYYNNDGYTDPLFELKEFYTEEWETPKGIGDFLGMSKESIKNFLTSHNLRIAKGGMATDYALENNLAIVEANQSRWKVKHVFDLMIKEGKFTEDNIPKYKPKIDVNIDVDIIVKTYSDSEYASIAKLNEIFSKDFNGKKWAKRLLKDNNLKTKNIVTSKATNEGYAIMGVNGDYVWNIDKIRKLVEEKK